MPQDPSRTGQNEYNPHESPADLIIGIDFGTTFTGVAYAFAGKQVVDKAKIADKVIVIKKWPGAADKEKIPTVLSYAGTSFHTSHTSHPRGNPGESLQGPGEGVCFVDEDCE